MYSTTIFNNPWFWIFLMIGWVVIGIFLGTMMKRDVKIEVRKELAKQNSPSVSDLLSKAYRPIINNNWSRWDEGKDGKKRQRYLYPYPSFEEMATDLDDDKQ